MPAAKSLKRSSYQDKEAEGEDSPRKAAAAQVSGGEEPVGGVLRAMGAMGTAHMKSPDRIRRGKG